MAYLENTHTVEQGSLKKVEIHTSTKQRDVFVAKQ